MPQSCDPVLRFVIEEDEAALFTLLLPWGVYVGCTTGVTIGELLIRQFGIGREYLEKRLSTVFLDGSPVDNIDKTFIESGMTLALSSSMPGLAGATLRRGGILSSMRRSITYQDKDRCPGEMREGFIVIKLFNILGEEIGPVFVRHGIRIEAVKMAGFISLSPDKARLASIMGKDKARDPEALVHMLEAFDAGMIEITTRHDGHERITP
jgi:hypothetical protein